MLSTVALHFRLSEQNMVEANLGIALSDNLKSFLATWGPIQWRRQLATSTPEPDGAIARMLGILAAIEDDAFYMQVKIRYTGAAKHVALREFNAIWLAEESEHARALAALAIQLGGEGTPRSRSHGLWSRDRRSLLTRPFLRILRILFPKGILAAYLTLGTVQEYVALTTYNAIADRTNDTATRDILHQIARQEARHMRFYKQSAAAVLLGSRSAQRFVQFALRRTWRPPGIDLLGYHQWFTTFESLLCDLSLRDRYLRIDEICSSLPGIGNQHFMHNFLSRYEREHAVSENDHTRALATV